MVLSHILEIAPFSRYLKKDKVAQPLSPNILYK
jgi:hypothetical protein